MLTLFVCVCFIYGYFIAHSLINMDGDAELEVLLKIERDMQDEKEDMYQKMIEEINDWMSGIPEVIPSIASPRQAPLTEDPPPIRCSQ
jgi:hypothetical protein